MIFIIGTGRSGTTLIAQMLNAHSKICVPHELQILFEYNGNGARLNEVFSSGESNDFSAQDFINLVEQRCPHRFDLFFDYANFFNRLKYPIVDLKRLVGDLFHEIAASKGKTLFAEQSPWYGQRIDLLNSLFPDAKYIHLVRDGRDVAISFARTPWWHNDVHQNLMRWQSEVENIMDASTRYLSSEQILHIRYEDLVHQPELMLQNICAHLDVEYESSMLNPANYIDYSQYSKINSAAISSGSLNAWKNSKNDSTFTDSCFAWKKTHAKEFTNISPNVAESLKTFGYEW